MEWALLRSIAIVLVGLATGLSACTVQINTGSGDTVGTTISAATVATEPEDGASTTKTDSAGGPVQDVRAAIVRIVTGPFTEPPVSESSSVGATGFFFDATGGVLTTNDAVAGADEIDVYLADDPLPHPATVVATDECRNLAVIVIEDTDHAVLPIAPAPLEAGDHVTIGGYPGQDGVYTVTDATVTTAASGGQDPGVAQDDLIGLYAPTWVGEAGAPVIQGDGRVGAMTVFVDDESTFAIPLSVLGETLQDLTEHSDITGMPAIGLNTTAFHDPTGTSGPDGLWVRGVIANSSSDKAGVEPGDVIVSIGGRDTTVKSGRDEYCLALADHSDGQPLPTVVYRPGDGLFYEGVVGADTVLVPNGEQWLPPTTTTAPPETTTTPSSGTATTPEFEGLLPVSNDDGGFDWITNFALWPVDETYPLYVEVEDAHGVIRSVKPDEWGLELSVDATPIYGSPEGPYGTGLQLYVIGGDSIEEYTSTWTTPGYQMGLAHKTPDDSWTPEMWVRSRDWSDRCTEGGTGVYDGGRFVGVYRFWFKCEGDYISAVKLDIAAWNDEHTVIIWISSLMFTVADYDAFARALTEHVFDTDRLTSEGY